MSLARKDNPSQTTDAKLAVTSENFSKLLIQQLFSYKVQDLAKVLGIAFSNCYDKYAPGALSVYNISRTRTSDIQTIINNMNIASQEASIATKLEVFAVLVRFLSHGAWNQGSANREVLKEILIQFNSSKKEQILSNEQINKLVETNFSVISKEMLQTFCKLITVDIISKIFENPVEIFTKIHKVINEQKSMYDRGGWNLMGFNTRNRGNQVEMLAKDFKLNGELLEYFKDFDINQHLNEATKYKFLQEKVSLSMQQLNKFFQQGGWNEGSFNPSLLQALCTELELFSTNFFQPFKDFFQCFQLVSQELFSDKDIKDAISNIEQFAKEQQNKNSLNQNENLELQGDGYSLCDTVMFRSIMVLPTIAKETQSDFNTLREIQEAIPAGGNTINKSPEDMTETSEIVHENQKKLMYIERRTNGATNLATVSMLGELSDLSENHSEGVNENQSDASDLELSALLESPKISKSRDAGLSASAPVPILPLHNNLTNFKLSSSEGDTPNSDSQGLLVLNDSIKKRETSSSTSTSEAPNTIIPPKSSVYVSSFLPGQDDLTNADMLFPTSCSSGNQETFSSDSQQQPPDENPPITPFRDTKPLQENPGEENESNSNSNKAIRLNTYPVDNSIDFGSIGVIDIDPLSALLGVGALLVGGLVSREFFRPSQS